MLNLMKIIDSANQLTLNRLNISQKIAYGFMVVDILWLIVGYIGYYDKSIFTLIDHEWTIFIFISFAFFSSIFMYIGLTRSIMKPFDELNNAANRISEGDLTFDIEVSSLDELGTLAGYFKKMIYSLRSLTGKMKDTSLKVASKAHKLSTSSHSMRVSIDQITNNTKGMAEGSSRQSVKIEKMNQTANEISQIMQQVTIGSQRTAQATKEANATAKELRQKSHDLMDKIMDIQDSVKSSALVIRNLDTNSEKIGEIVGVITDISDQTNLLALNAAIEAARAGEHGRGFAVVADEVRKLADESRNSARKITELIKEIQQETKKAVGNMEQGTRTVVDGSRMIEATVLSIESIEQATENAANMFTEIIEIGKMQDDSMKNVISSFDEISTVNRQSIVANEEAVAGIKEQAESMNMLADISRELEELSCELQNEIAIFKQKEK